MKKTYTCDQWPSLRLGRIQFRDGKYATEDESIQQMIENNVAYGVQIQLAETQDGEPQLHPAAEEKPAPRRGPGRAPGGAARQGQTGTANLRPKGEADA